MKNKLNKIVVLLLAAFAWVACTEHTEYDDTGFSAVEKLLYPSNNAELELLNQSSAKCYFEWQAARRGTPIYTVVFYASDQKTEVGRYLADNNGQRAALSMPHPTLSRVAAEAGIASGKTGDIYWTVAAGLDNAERLAAEKPHKLTVTRYAAAIDVPYSLYIEGDGTEYAEPCAMKNLGDDRFEIFTKLNGDFRFVNRVAEGSHRTFGAEDGALVEGDDAMGMASEGVYHVIADFSTGTVSLKKIAEVAMLRAGVEYDGEPLATLTYAGNGLWKAPGFTVPADGDDRYRFRARYEDDTYEIWGSKEGTDASAPASISGGSYFDVYIFDNPENLDNPNEYARIYKFHPQLKGLTLTVEVNLSTVGGYAHNFDLGFEVEAIPVKTFNTPAADAKIVLTTVDAPAETFSWERASQDAKMEQLTVYTVVFFSDAAGETEIAAVGADNKNSVDIKHTELDAIAEKAGAEAGAEATVYWSIRNKVVTETAMADAAPRKLTLTRIKGMPTNVYLTGAATEFGSQYKAMRSLGANKYEIYTKLTAGKYSITDGDNAGARKFVVKDGSLAEGAGDMTCDQEAVYRINLDFAAATAKFEKITDVELYRSGNNDSPIAKLAYKANGVWEIDGYTEPASGVDNRYRFKAKADGVTEVWGSEKGRDAVETVPRVPENYWLYIHTGKDVTGDAWGRIFQFEEAVRNVDLTIQVIMSPDAGDHYTHKLIRGYEPGTPAPAVTSLTAPAADASLELTKDGGNVTFSWEKAVASTPAIERAMTYSLVFYKDASAAMEVHRVECNKAVSAALSQGDLETVAGKAGIASESAGDVYWGVETRLSNQTTKSSECRKLTLTRIKGIPEALYIKGAATEYGNEQKALKNLGGGKFEIYTKLKAGKYSFTNGARNFVISGGAIAEGDEMTSTGEAVYRISFDFSAETAKMEKITDVKYDFKMSGHVVMLDYQGDGVWGKNNFPATNGGNDTRFYLYMSFDGNRMRWGNQRADYSGADPGSFSAEGDSNFRVYLMQEPSDEWSYYFKFPGSYRGTQNTVSVKLNLNSSVGNYYTYVTDQTIF